MPGVKEISLGKDTIFCGDSLLKKLEVKNRIFDSYLWSDSSTGDTLIVKKSGLYWLEIERSGCKKRDTIILTLLRFFSDGVAALTMLFLVLGTNYFHEAFDDYLQPHAILFTGYAMLMYYTMLWHDTKQRI